MPDTIGKQLKQTRESRNLTIRQVVEGTRIRAHLIEAMEADNFDVLPSPVQARAFLRLYAEFLGLSLDELITRQRDSAGSTPEPTDVPSSPEPIAPAETPPPPPAGSGKPARTKKRKAPRVETSPTEAGPAVPLESAEPLPVPAAEAPSSPPPASDARPVFIEIGRQLRTQREILSLTLDEIERHIHVRKHYLQALENGSFDQLPSSVQARGMLNNYANFLDLDVDAILLKFADGLQAQLMERQAPPAPDPEKPADKPRRFRLPRLRLPASIRRYLSTDLLVGGGLFVFLIVFAVWGTSRVISLGSAATPPPTAPSILNVMIASPVDTAMPTSTPGTEAAPAVPAGGSTPVIAIPTGSGSGAVHIVVIAVQSAWARVSVDGKTKYEGILTAGTAYSYDGNTQIEVLTGNGAALSISYNQNELGPMGTLGEVVDRIYTANAVLNPTATFTATPTASPIPSATPRPTATSRTSPVPSRTP